MQLSEATFYICAMISIINTATLIKMFLKRIILSVFILHNTLVLADQQPNSCQQSVKTLNHQQAITSCLESLENAKSYDSEDTLFTLLELANLYGKINDYSKSDYYLNEIKNHPNFRAQTKIQYEWNRKFGANYLHQLNYQQAHSYFDAAYQIAKKEDDIEWLAKSTNDLGLINHKLSHYKESLLYYKDSLKYKEQIGNLYYIATTLNNLGLINKDINNYEQAIYYYSQALDAFLQYTQTEGFDKRALSKLSHLYEDLAVVYAEMDDHEKQHQYIQKLIETFSEKFSTSDQVRALKNLANSYLKQEQVEEAKLFIDQALMRNIDNPLYGSEIYLMLSQIAFKQAHTKQSESYLNQALELATIANNPQVLADVYQQQFSLHKATEQSELAIQSLVMHYKYQEQELKNQYASDLQLVQEQIEKERFQRKFIEKNLLSQQQKMEIQSLTNIILFALLTMTVFGFSTGFLWFKKRKEKQAFLDNIASHKEKLFLLETSHKENVSDDADNQLEIFRESLVQVMLDAVSLWEKTTQLNTIELAERSRIWKVSIDSGRLRTRSMDKYLSLQKLPLNPRWKNVVKTCHYILSECDLEPSDRQLLNQRLEGLMDIIKNRSMSNGKRP